VSTLLHTLPKATWHAKGVKRDGYDDGSPLSRWLPAKKEIEDYAKGQIISDRKWPKTRSKNKFRRAGLRKKGLSMYESPSSVLCRSVRPCHRGVEGQTKEHTERGAINRNMKKVELRGWNVVSNLPSSCFSFRLKRLLLLGLPVAAPLSLARQPGTQKSLRR